MSKKILPIIFGSVLFLSSLFALPNLSFALEYLSVSNITQTTAVVTVNGIDSSGQYQVDIGTLQGSTLTFPYSKTIQIGEALPLTFFSWTVDNYPPNGFSPNTNYKVVLKRINPPTDPNVTSISFTTTKAVAVITSISPTSGKIGETITINGNNFSSINKVYIGGIDVKLDFHALSTTQITAPIPVGATAGKVRVETTNNGTAESSQTLSIVPTTTADAPTITDFSVTSSTAGSTIGSTTGKTGDVVTINGTNLIYISQILFDDAPAVTLTNSPEKVTVTVPSSASSGKITIKTANGDVSSSADFTVAGTTSQETCFDGIQNQNETDVDVGGVCTTSPPGGGNEGGNNSKVGGFSGLVPDCNKGPIDPVTQNYKNPCDFSQVIKIINNVITFLIVDFATPLFALIIVYVGWLYLSDMGSSKNKEKAKKILWNALFGFVIALVAWLLVKTILTSLGFEAGDDAKFFDYLK